MILKLCIINSRCRTTTHAHTARKKNTGMCAHHSWFWFRITTIYSNIEYRAYRSCIYYSIYIFQLELSADNTFFGCSYFVHLLWYSRFWWLLVCCCHFCFIFQCFCHSRVWHCVGIFIVAYALTQLLSFVCVYVISKFNRFRIFNQFDLIMSFILKRVYKYFMYICILGYPFTDC